MGTLPKVPKGSNKLKRNHLNKVKNHILGMQSQGINKKMEFFERGHRIHKKSRTNSKLDYVYTPGLFNENSHLPFTACLDGCTYRFLIYCIALL